jgi:Tol biopolymer transport system component
VTLTGLAANCRITGTDPVTVNVTAQTAAAATFDVACGGSELALTVYEGYLQASLYTADLDGAHLTRLTEPALDTYGAAWSPDGRTIAFTGMVAGESQVFTVGADGTGVANVTQRSYEYDDSPRWSPDGAQILFNSNRDGSHEVYVMNPDGSGQTRVSSIAGPNKDDSDPSWSPDGKKIVFISDRCVWTMKPDGTELTQLTTPPTESLCLESTPVYSPDGAKIAYVSNRDGDYEIYVMNADGTGQTRLTSNTVSDVSPTWSPDGTRIAFVEDGNVVIMKLDGSDRTVIDLAKDVSTVDWRK